MCLAGVDKIREKREERWEEKRRMEEEDKQFEEDPAEEAEPMREEYIDITPDDETDNSEGAMETSEKEELELQAVTDQELFRE